MKHELERLGPDGFEKIIQALMTKLFGITVKIYGDGPDRQREALIVNAHYEICGGIEVLGKTIVQAKFKSPEGSAKDWEWLQAQLKKELDGFIDKSLSEPKLVPETWMFFTNIILTPAKGGLKDKADAFVDEYKELIPHIYVLGADEVRALLDAHPDVARRYAAFITPSDVLEDALRYLEELNLKPLIYLLEHVRQRFLADAPVRLEQAGALDKGIDVRHVYTDLPAFEQSSYKGKIDRLASAFLRFGDNPQPRRVSLSNKIPKNNIVLVGNAGQGKSTICQYICQLYRASLLEHYLPEVETAQGYSVEAGIRRPNCERFPMMIRLKDYAAWLGKRDDGENGSVLHYLVWLIKKDAEGILSVPELRDLLKSYSWIFFFDGLDEVPASSNRAEVLKQIDLFLMQDLIQSNCDSIIICTTRPQGYDRDFSPDRFRHIELRDMSPELCLCYIDKLLYYLEPDQDLREKYHTILKRSLDDPLVAKLMLNPLYTAILVLLVKSGSTPPTRRFELFDEYFKTVIKREKQRELLPCLFEGNDAWIDDLHGEIAYLLQRESESEKNAAAELSVSRCCTLIRQYIDEEGFVGDLDDKTDELFWAITVRLPFLAKTTDAEGESCVLFPLRSLQEYCAAKYILCIDDTEERYNILQAISLSAYWRNVFLFVAGAFSAQNKQSVIDNIYMIVRRNNGDPVLCCQEQIAYQFAIPGSRLALDLLCDNLFKRRRGQDRYIDITSELLDWDYAGDSLFERFLRLPEAVLHRIIIDYAIPRLKEDRNPNEVAFALLWIAARLGNEEAWNCLEEVAETLQSPSSVTAEGLFYDIGMEGLGPKILRQCISWCQYYPCLSLSRRNYKVRSFIRSCLNRKDASLIIDMTRWIFYTSLLDPNEFADGFGRIYGIEGDDFIYRLIENNHYRRSCDISNKLLLPTCFVPDEDTYWAGLKEILANYNLKEISSLAEFKIEPSAKNLRKLLTSLDQLPLRNRISFYRILERQDWVLKEVAEALMENTNITMLIQCYDEKFIKNCRVKEVLILQALQAQDVKALSDLNAWDSLNSPRIKMRSSTFSMFFTHLIGKPLHYQEFYPSDEMDNSAEFRAKIFSQFALCFNDKIGGYVALIAFATTPIQMLVSIKIYFPRRIAEFGKYDISKNISDGILKRIEIFTKVGGSYLEAYALIPFFFDSSIGINVLSYYAALSAKYYSDIRTVKNDCALLGVILLQLVRVDLISELGGMLREDLYHLLPKNENLFLSERIFECFSLAGAMLLQEVWSDVYKGTDKEKQFVEKSKYVILQKLEALPAEQDKLPTLPI